MALSATINGRPTSLINGVVTKADLTPGTGGAPATLSVKGKDLTAAMAFFDFSGIPYPAMPPVARVALILAKYAWLGVIPQLVPSLESPPLPTEKIPRHQDSDLDYIKHLADEAGYTFFMKPGPAPATSFAYWGPEIRIGEVQPALTVESSTPSNTEELSFSFGKEEAEIPIVYIQNAAHQGADPDPHPRGDPLPSAARRHPAAAAEDHPAARHRAAQPVRGAGAGLRLRGEARRPGQGPRPHRRPALRAGAARPGAGRGSRRRRGLRRGALRRERHPRPQARQLQAELHAEAQRPHADASHGAGMTEKYYGKYRGTVVNNVDPMLTGRIQAIVPDVSAVAPTSWAMPCFPVAGIQTGSLGVPPVGAGVWIEFERGDPDYPVWTGCSTPRPYRPTRWRRRSPP